MSLTRPIQLKRVVLVMVGSGALLSCFALPQYFKARESERWPQAKGTITTSHLEVGYFKGMKGYYGIIGYDYRVGAVPFHGTRLSFSRDHLAVKEAWQPIVDSYPVSKPVTVYYDPRNPGFAVLEPGLHGEMHSLFILCIILIAFLSVSFLVILLTD